MADLPSLHRQLVAMIHANGQADVQPITRMILDGLDERARKLLRKIEDDMRAAAAGFDMRLSMLSLYGGEPAVRDLIRDARWHRSHPLVKIPALRPVVWEAAE